MPDSPQVEAVAKAAEHWVRRIEWTPGLGQVEGMARHPSMQRKTDEEIRERRADMAARLGEAQSYTPAQAAEAGVDLAEYHRRQREHVEACDRALALRAEWREANLDV